MTEFRDSFGFPRAEEAVYIPLQLNPDLPLRRHITFNNLAQNRKPRLVGEVADKALFSKSLGWPENAGKEEFFIKAPGTGFYIPEKYAQFIPTLEQEIADYYSRYGNDGYCGLGVLQARIDPKPDEPAFIDAHKDLHARSLQEEGRTPNHYSYIVSNCLQTGFSDYKFSPEEIEKIKNAGSAADEMDAILNKATYASFTRPYGIAGFDSTVAHAIANPTESVIRTALNTVFYGPGTPPPPKLFNPWLEEAIRQQREQKVPTGSGRAALPAVS